MKQVSGFSITILFFFACTSSNILLVTPNKNLINIAQNEERYELIVLDPDFDTWFVTTWSPVKNRSQAYYSYWNQ